MPSLVVVLTVLATLSLGPPPDGGLRIGDLLGESRATSGPTVLVPYLALEYRYSIVPFGGGAGFEQPGFDDSAFPIGDAGFGTPSGGCPLNNPNDVKTEWPLNTDILIRRNFDVPRGATEVKVGVAIDNDVQVFINGQDVSGGLKTHEGCSARDDFIFPVADRILHLGANLLAVRGRDRGVLSYLDVRITATISNQAPTADAGGPYAGVEGSPITFDARGSSDPEGTSLTFRWDFDGDGTWDTPFGDGPTATYTWGDDWTGAARVEVSDGTLSAVASAPVTVGNVAPTPRSDVTAKALVDVTLRVAGEKWHDVTLTIESGGGPAGTASVTRSPGSPDDQRVTIAGIEIDLFQGPWSATAAYTPADDPVNGQVWGATPAWITVDAAGLSVRLHHTFNVRQPETWTWTVEDLSVFLGGVPLTFEAVASDLGSDDLTFSWDFGDGTKESRTYFNDGAGPDPFPSPGGVFPVQVMNSTTHVYTTSGNFTVTLNVTDDDGGLVTAVRNVLVCDADDECGGHDRSDRGHDDRDDGSDRRMCRDAGDSAVPCHSDLPGGAWTVVDTAARDALPRDTLLGSVASRP